MKLTKSFFMTCMLVVTSVFTACTDVDQQTEDNPESLVPKVNNIRFAIATSNAEDTRTVTDGANKTKFVAGDAIGLFVVKHSKTNQNAELQAQDNHYHHVKLTMNQEGEWISDTDLFYASKDELLDFYAYYPYRQAQSINPLNLPFEVQTDQSAREGDISAFDSSELLMANPAKNIAKNEVVTLKFRHMMAMVRVEVPTHTMNGVILKGVGPRETLEVYLPNAYTAGMLNLANETFAVDKDAESKKIRLQRVEQDSDDNYLSSYTYRALVPAQTMPTGEAVAYYQDAKSYSLNAQTKTLSPGRVQRYTAELPFTSIHTEAVPAGSFWMGLDDKYTFNSAADYQLRPRHYVTLTQNYRMSKYEITYAQYATFLNQWNIDHPEDQVSYGTHYYTDYTHNINYYIYGLPALNWFTWQKTNVEDVLYIYRTHLDQVNGKWIVINGKENVAMNFISHYGARIYAEYMGANLPTNAQWEYVGTNAGTGLYYWGDDIEQIKDYGWLFQDIEHLPLAERNSPHEVGLKKPNQWGIYDLYGNVAEWCQDAIEYRDKNSWGKSPWQYPSSTPENPSIDPLTTEGADRVSRGAGWMNSKGALAGSLRTYHRENFSDTRVGIRLVYVQ